MYERELTAYFFLVFAWFLTVHEVSEELGTEEYSKMTGLANKERVDHGLYRKDQSEEQARLSALHRAT